MRYFVTGGTGFLGRHLIDQLLDRGEEVVALVRNPATSEPLPPEVSVVRGDITDKASMRDGMHGVDGVYHLAAWYQLGINDRETAYQVNVDGTRNVLELMRELDIPSGVYTSSLAVNSDTGGRVVDESYRYNGRHLTVYDRTKWLAHYEVAEPMIDEGLPLVIVMPGAVYGPGDRGPMWLLWDAYFKNNLPCIPARTGYCWGHVTDTVRAHLQAMDNGTPGESYIVAGEPHRLTDVFDMAESITGISAPPSVPPAIFRTLSRIVSPIERIWSPPPEYSAEALRVLGGVTYWGNSDKAIRELGIQHRPFRDGLETMLEAELSGESESRK